MSKELSFIVVIGKDRKGIVAKVSNFLYKNNINIEEISQQVLNDYFVMTAGVDVQDSKISLQELRDQLTKLGEKMNLKIQLHHEKIFKMMHRV
ncbi:MAG: ACT domain-containing protein [Candidatus Woesearchaeota archaeon]